MRKARNTKPRVIYDRSSGKVIYDELIRILGAMTGARWGYHRIFGVVSYIECEKHSIRIAAGETRARKIDITLQRLDVTSPEWEAAAAYELKCKLLSIVNSDDLIAAINAYQIDPKYVAEIEYIKVNSAIGATIDASAISTSFNKYIDECLYDLKINIDC